ncbi:hypothetical protein HER15_13200 [Tenacibaculum mesophilum]|uniref:Uncharacterized protein n=1 Tax=Tenacibaculum mesophilum TaxID=104268 RepID=A0AAE9MQF0_9FLAO|nr:hypothetical protein [Tenacibaculum mesophilum]UTD16368.1 hypothetical protein HER15_13200 [Tenacibaculum mesophilum]
MSTQLYFITSGKMTIQLNGMAFGKHLKDPVKNIKHFGTKQHSLELVSNNPNNFTDWGIIELIDLNPSMGQLTVSIDCDDWGWFGTAQIQLKMNNQIVLNDNFQSGVKGPIGNPLRIKRFPITNF